MTAYIGEQLLLECVNGPTPEAWRRIANLGQAEWQDLIGAAARHLLTPQLYERLSTCPDRLEILETHLQRMRKSYLANGVRNQLIYRDLGEVLRVLQEDGIAVIVLKGACLAATVYPNISVRFMCDIDLLVREADLRAAVNSLQKIGYAFRKPFDLDEHEKPATSAKHLPPLHKGEHPRIELHWRISPTQFQHDEARVWDRSRSISLAGVQARILGPEDLVLYLCLHGGSHHLFGMGMRLLCDLRATLERYQGEIDWDLLLKLAKAWRAEKSAYVAFRLAHELAHAPVSDQALQSLKPVDFQEQWWNAARERLLQAEDATESEAAVLKPINYLAGLLFAKMSIGGHRSLWRAAFPSRKYMSHYMAEHHSVPLTSSRRFTCYITRLVSWIGRGFHIAGFLIMNCRQAPQHLRDLRNEHLLRKWLT